MLRRLESRQKVSMVATRNGFGEEPGACSTITAVGSPAEAIKWRLRASQVFARRLEGIHKYYDWVKLRAQYRRRPSALSFPSNPVAAETQRGKASLRYNASSSFHAAGQARSSEIPCPSSGGPGGGQ